LDRGIEPRLTGRGFAREDVGRPLPRGEGGDPSARILLDRTDEPARRVVELVARHLVPVGIRLEGGAGLRGRGEAYLSCCRGHGCRGGRVGRRRGGRRGTGRKHTRKHNPRERCSQTHGNHLLHLKTSVCQAGDRPPDHNGEPHVCRPPPGRLETSTWSRGRRRAHGRPVLRGIQSGLGQAVE
jgi:hypothetical protein